MSEKFPYGYDLNAYIDKAFDEKFPYGYDLNAYIDKAFEQMKADFPWATRDMIAEHTYFGIEKMGDDYQYVRYYNELSPDILNVEPLTDAAATGFWSAIGFRSMRRAAIRFM